jgi:RNA polymerase sigma factor (sigma-70 family)
VPAPPSSLDVGLLAAAIREGDRTAESLLVEHFTPRVRAMIRARLRDPDLAGDLTQETLVAVLHAARNGQIRDPAHLSAFVQGVARNLVNNYTRRRQQHPEVELDDERQNLTVTEDGTLKERRELLVRALRTLEKTDRDVLRLTLLDGLKPAEIAARSGSSPEAIRTRKTRALKRVMEAVERLSRPAALYHLTKKTDSHR